LASPTSLLTRKDLGGVGDLEVLGDGPEIMKSGKGRERIAEERIQKREYRRQNTVDRRQATEARKFTRRPWGGLEAKFQSHHENTPVEY
jgi:hypothetical protein